MKLQSLTDSNGKTYKGILIKDPTKPFKTWRAFSIHYESMDKPHMQAENHHFKSQDQLLLQALCQARSHGTLQGQQQNICSKHPRDLPTLEELLEAWKGPAENDDEKEEEKIDKEDNACEGMAAVKTDAVMAVPSVYTEAARKSKRSNSNRNLGEEASEMTMNMEDEVVGQALPASHWINKITVPKIMSGQKLGKELGFATACLTRLDENQKTLTAKGLRKHPTSCLLQNPWLHLL